MSDNDVKKRCTESDEFSSLSSTNTAPSVSQPSGAAPIKSFRDLIFNVSGTMPASAVQNSQNTTGPFAKKRKLVSDMNVSDADTKSTDTNAEEKSSNSDGKEDLAGVVSEADVGITEFISQHDGFSGILKQRYSDFVVHEIDQDGQVVRLTDISRPTHTETQSPDTEEDGSSLLSEVQQSQLKQLQESKNLDQEVLIPSLESKDERMKIHHYIKSSFANLNSNGIERDGKKYIRVTYRARREERKPECFSKTAGDYTKFVMYKENTETQHAISVIAKYLRINAGCFGYAGTKDRRGKTAQEVTVQRIPPLRLYQLNSCLRNITLGNFRICKKPLKLGQLSGNHFIIVLRNVTGSDEQIDIAMKSLRDVGFINYYGMQRFGTTRVTTHNIGRALLRGDWSEAVELILKPREGDRLEMVKARQVWQSTHDAGETLSALRGFHCAERQLLEGLKRSAKNDIVNALSNIPRNMRLMYVHAYQSYVWNSVVSRRVREFGLVPRPGDLAVRGPVTSDVYEHTESAEVESECRVEPVVITEDNVFEFAITDLVLPLPGYDVKYPDNETAAWYRELLAADGFQDFSFRNRVKDYSLAGNYRKMVVKPGDLSWEILFYNDFQLPLVQGDIDVIHNKPLASASQGVIGKFKALKVELSLPSSTYATMAVREVLKCNTSSAHQATLNVT